MDIDKEITIDDIMNDLEKLTFFNDKDEYMKLHDASLIDESDIETDSELFEILEETFKRYNRYIKNIVFTDKSLSIKEFIKSYIKQYRNHNVNEYELFKLMKYIDEMILDMIHASKEPKLWL